MSTSLILVQFWGWLLVISGAIYLIRGDALKELFRQMEDKGFTLVTGYISFIVGLVSLLIYREWSSGPMVVVTVFGWLALLKGIVRLAFPEHVKKLSKYFEGQAMLTKVLLAIAIVLGLWLLISVR